MAAGPQRSRHLWIIATEPVNDRAVIVSVTTLRHNVDQTVVLQKGDHPFIEHQSGVFFGDSRIVNITLLAEQVEDGYVSNHHPCDPWLIDEIAMGLRASPLTPKKILNFLDGLP